MEALMVGFPSGTTGGFNTLFLGHAGSSGLTTMAIEGDGCRGFSSWLSLAPLLQACRVPPGSSATLLIFAVAAQGTIMSRHMGITIPAYDVAEGGQLPPLSLASTSSDRILCGI